MDPKFRIGKSIHVSYTRKDIMEDNYSNLWSKADTLANKLVNLQEKVIGLLPEANRLLPSRVEALKDEEAQANFLNYIRLRALYAFAEKLWKVIEEQSRKLAEAHDKDNRYERENAEAALEKTLNIAATIPFDELTTKPENGLTNLYNYLLLFQGVPNDFQVFRELSFRDIIGTADYSTNGTILKSTIDDEYPTSPNIGELLDDDEMIRVY